MKVLFLKKVNDCSFHGLGFGTNVKKKLKSDIRENERKWVGVYMMTLHALYLEC